MLSITDNRILSAEYYCMSNLTRKKKNSFKPLFQNHFWGAFLNHQVGNSKVMGRWILLTAYTHIVLANNSHSSSYSCSCSLVPCDKLKGQSLKLVQLHLLCRKQRRLSTPPEPYNIIEGGLRAYIWPKNYLNVPLLYGLLNPATYLRSETFQFS